MNHIRKSFAAMVSMLIMTMGFAMGVSAPQAYATTDASLTGMNVTVDYGSQPSTPDSDETYAVFNLRETVDSCESLSGPCDFSGGHIQEFALSTTLGDYVPVVALESAFYGGFPVDGSGGGVFFNPFVSRAFAQSLPGVTVSGHVITVDWSLIELEYLNQTGSPIFAGTGDELVITVGVDVSANPTDTAAVVANVYQYHFFGDTSPSTWKTLTENGGPTTGPITVFSSQVSTALPAPTLEPAANIGDTSADLNWNDVTGASTYLVQYSQSPTYAATDPSTVVQTSVSSNTTLTGLTAGTTYYAHVQAQAGSNSSVYSNDISFTTTNSGLDSDGDGLTDLEEATYGTDPLDADTDDDDLSDGDEVNVHGTDPLDLDSDDDTLIDGDEVNVHGTDPNNADIDNDNLNDAGEIAAGTDPSNPDSDGDFLTDGDEVNIHGTDPLNIDTDIDGLSDSDEVVGPNPTDPLDPDSDDDDLLDGFEIDNNTDPNNPDTDNDTLTDGDEVNVHGTDPLHEDTDGDTLTDADEINIHGTDPLNADSDNDGLDDDAELAAGTDPNNPDSDFDTISDGDEVNVHGTNPLDEDTDGDDLLDATEITIGTDPNSGDSDGDSLGDGYEINTSSTDPLDPDSDDDDLDDGAEVFEGTDPNNPDTDGDDLTDGEEISNPTDPTDPLDADSDDDTLTDGEEVNTHKTNPNSADTDGDTLSDADEINVHGTDPLDADSDNDNINDADEISGGTDPLDSDSDDDNLSDGAELVAGTDPNNPDSDFDTLTDGEEVNIHGTDPLSDDTDGDNLSDWHEINTHGTDATQADTDGDTYNDDVEITAGSDPNDPNSVPNAAPEFGPLDYTVGGELPEGGWGYVDIDVTDPEGDEITCKPTNEAEWDEILRDGEDWWKHKTDDVELSQDCQVGVEITIQDVEVTAEDEHGAETDAQIDVEIDNNAVNQPPTWRPVQPDHSQKDGNMTLCEEDDMRPDGSYVIDLDDFLYDPDADNISTTNNIGVPVDINGVPTGGSVTTDPSDSSQIIYHPGSSSEVLEGGWVSVWVVVSDNQGNRVGVPLWFKISHNVQDVEVSNVTDTEAQIDWSQIIAPGDTVHGYEVEVANTNIPTDVQEYSIPANQTTAPVTGLTPDQEYEVNVTWKGDDQDGDGEMDRSDDSSNKPTFVTLPADSDDDGVTDEDEINIHGTDPNNPDSDFDTLTDGEEINVHGTDPLSDDTDGDNLGDWHEINTHGTDPTQADTDFDTYNDDVEILAGSDPNDPNSVPNGAPTFGPLDYTVGAPLPGDGKGYIEIEYTDPDGDEVTCKPTNEADWDEILRDGADWWKHKTDDVELSQDCQVGVEIAVQDVEVTLADEHGNETSGEIDIDIDNNPVNQPPTWRPVQPNHSQKDGNMTLCEEDDMLVDGSYKIDLDDFLYDPDADNISTTNNIGVPVDINGVPTGGSVTTDPNDPSGIIYHPGSSSEILEGGWVSVWVVVNDGHGNTVGVPLWFKISHNVQNVTVSNVTDTEAQIDWDAIIVPGDTVHGYEVEVANTNIPTDVTTYSIPANQTTAPVSGLTPEESYDVNVTWFGDDKDFDGSMDRSDDSTLQPNFTTLPEQAVCEAHDIAYYNVPATLECDDQTVVNTWSEYLSYVSNNYGNYSDLKVKDLAGAPSDIVIESPCAVTFARETQLNANSVHIDSLAGLKIRKESGLISTTEDICLTSGMGDVVVGNHSDLSAQGDINFIAYLQAKIAGNSTMTAGGDVFMTSLTDETIVGKNVTVNAAGDVMLEAELQTRAKAESNITAANLNATVTGETGVISGSKNAVFNISNDITFNASGFDSELNLKKNSSYNVGGNFHGSAATCSVNKADWSAGSVSGNCITSTTQ